jgi:hypothetical protein
MPYATAAATMAGIGFGRPGPRQRLDGVQGVAEHVVVDGVEVLEHGKDGEPGAGHRGQGLLEVPHGVGPELGVVERRHRPGVGYEHQ